MRGREEYDDASEYIQDRLRQRKLKFRLIIIIVLLVIAFAIIFFVEYYRVRYVTVEGSTHYTDEEIEDYVMSGFLGNNSLVLSWHYKNQSIDDIPFIESMDVEVTAHDTVQIKVYEKSLAGYVVYLGRYMYFDRDGIVVESSTERVEGVCEVTGLEFDHIIVNEALPVEDVDIFSRILETTQLLGKYNLTADRMYVGSADKISIYFDEVCVNLGEDEYMDEKISNLAQILPSLEGMAGTVEMSEFTPDTTSITFTEKES